MDLCFVGLLIVLSCCMPANTQGEDYSACFERNVEILGVNETTKFSYRPDRQMGEVCTDDRDCSDEFKCVSTTADPPVDAENTAALPAFCQAPSNNMVADDDIAIFIPMKCRCIMDLVYVIDRSGSMETTRLNYQIQFLKDLTNSIGAIPQNKYCVKFAIASFNHAAQGHLGLTYSVPVVISALNAILTAGSSGGSNVHLGMTVGNNYFGTFGDRSYAPNVMLVTTDLIYGSVSFLTTIQAASLTIRNSGTCIHAVGMSTVPSPSLVVLQAITGNLALVSYSLQDQLHTILDNVQRKLCDKCKPCVCPKGYQEYDGRCYRIAGPACWFYANAICHQIGAKFTTNWAAAMSIGGHMAWFNHPNSPIQVNMMPFCTSTTQSVACCEQRPIVCERACVSQYPTQTELADLAVVSPRGDQAETALMNGK